MIRKILILVLAVLPLCLAAQEQRVATVNVQQILRAMPQKKLAEVQLQELSSRYQKEYQQAKEEFNRKYADYQALAADASTPATITERRMQEIQENDRQIQDYLKKADDDLKARQAELEAPLLQKISEAVKAVATELKVTYVIDTSAAGNAVIYSGPDAIDLTAAVRSRLGL